MSGAGQEDRGPDDGRLFPARPLIGVSIAVIRDGRVLLAARANEPMRGVWTLPGGLLEAGESLAEGALRELQEEVGALAEDEGHHPDITFGWGYATVSLHTHKIKGLHENDFIMAAKINRLAQA